MLQLTPLLSLLVLLGACEPETVPLQDERLVSRLLSEEKPRPWKACVTVTRDSPSRDVLYFLHGGNGEAASWIRPEGWAPLVRRTWEREGRQAPVVVTVSFGPHWLLVPQGEDPRSGLLEFFLDHVMPAVESTLEAPPRKRLLLGSSMGGFNAVMLLLKRPEIFSRAAILCPAVPVLSPFAPAERVAAFARENGVPGSDVEHFLGLLREVFPDEASWETVDPLRRARTGFGPATPPLYVSCGREDEMGFFPAARGLAEAARENGVPVVWAPLPGRHCSIDPEGVARFLLSGEAGPSEEKPVSSSLPR